MGAVEMLPLLPWAPEGDEGDCVAGRDDAADGLHAASAHEVDDGFPAIAGIIIEHTLELRRGVSSLRRSPGL